MLDKRHDKRDSVVVNGTQQIKKLTTWLYQDANIFLERKYGKFIELKQKLGEC